MLRDLDGRISDTEAGVTDYRAARQNLEQVILTYLWETLEPEFNQIRAVADLGLLFEARSSSLVTVEAGRQTFVVCNEDKGRFSAPGYIGIFKLGDPGVFMAGVRVSYDKASGTLVVDIDRVAGGGVSAADWQIVAVSGTDYLEAAALAQAARDLAEQYRTKSQSARDDALAHSGTANSYRMAAEEAKGSAQTAQARAEDARDVAGEHLLGVQAIATHYLPPGASNHQPSPGGGALATGDLYWNTTASEMRTWNGSAWGAAYVPGGADVVTWNGRTGAVTPADGDYSASQVTVSPSVAGANRVQAALAALETAVGTIPGRVGLALHADRAGRRRCRGGSHHARRGGGEPSPCLGRYRLSGPGYDLIACRRHGGGRQGLGLFGRGLRCLSWSRPSRDRSWTTRMRPRRSRPSAPRPPATVIPMRPRASPASCRRATSRSSMAWLPVRTTTPIPPATVTCMFRRTAPATPTRSSRLPGRQAAVLGQRRLWRNRRPSVCAERD